MTHVIDIGVENDPASLPRATDPATREGLFWVMERALREAYNVALILDIQDWVETLQKCRTATASRRETEREEAGIERLR